MTAGAATFINNANTSFVVTLLCPRLPATSTTTASSMPPTTSFGEKTEGTNFDLGGNGDETGGSANIVDMADYNFGSPTLAKRMPAAGGARGEYQNQLNLMACHRVPLHLAISRLRAPGGRFFAVEPQREALCAAAGFDEFVERRGDRLVAARRERGVQVGRSRCW